MGSFFTGGGFNPHTYGVEFKDNEFSFFGGQKDMTLKEAVFLELLKNKTSWQDRQYKDIPDKEFVSELKLKAKIITEAYFGAIDD